MRPAWTSPLITLGATIGVLSVAISPVVGLVAMLSVPALAILVSRPSARLIAVVLGALVVFQSNASGGKVAYIGLAVLCCALSGFHMARNRTAITDCFRPLLLGGGAAAAMLAISALVARDSGVTMGSWFRDALPYVLLVALPIIGIDAGQDLSITSVDWMMALLGIFCAVGFALDWLNRRGVSGLGVGRIILATSVLPALCFTYALSKADRGWHAIRWLLVALAILAILLVTGTRTNIVFGVGVIGVIGWRSRSGINPLRLAAYLLGIVGALAVTVPWLASQLISDPAFFSGRRQAALAAIHGNVGDDQSYIARHHAYVVARDQFLAHPWFGAGPGAVEGSDAPWIVPAKFGIVGLSILVLFLICLAIGVWRTRKVAGPLPIHAAARGWALILICLTPFGPWTEDKGLALALTLLVAAAVNQARTATQGQSSYSQHPVTVVST